MKIWVDADACPGPIRDIIIRAAERLQIKTTFVANKFLRLNFSQNVNMIQVPQGADVADSHIVQMATEDDLVVTQDIPLASELVAKNIVVLDPRGDLHTKESIGERLSVRNFMDQMRGAGLATGGPKPFGDKEKQRFANAFDSMVTKLLKRQSN